MSVRPDVRAAGDGALLLQLEAAIDPAVNERVIAIADTVRQQAVPGVRDVVSTFRSVAVYFHPLRADPGQLRLALERASETPSVPLPGRRHEIAVSYGGEDGPDLAEVAAWARLSPSEVIDRHAHTPYRVYMLGFQPGFAYLGLVDPAIAIPRRATPRLRVAAGSVGIAARQTGIYPAESPGGWQIIGRTAEALFDPAESKARLAPGDTVVFVNRVGGHSPRTVRSRESASTAATPGSGRRVTVLRPGLFTTIQTTGRWGQQGSGVPVSGAMDLVSHAIANAAAGNGPDARTLEVTIVGPELRLEHDATLAVAGADLSPTLDGSHVPARTPVRGRAGSVLRFGARMRGARAYVAFDGGVQADHHWPVRPVVAGQSVALGPPSPYDGQAVTSRMAIAEGGARLRVLPGPQDDQVPAAVLDVLLSSRLTVSPQSNRMGYRLAGATVPASSGEMISEATFPGAIQIPPSGNPILLMADRQTTGGYPQVATVITADLPIAGQLAPGDWVEFEMCSIDDARRALIAQEGMGASGS